MRNRPCEYNFIKMVSGQGRFKPGLVEQPLVQPKTLFALDILQGFSQEAVFFTVKVLLKRVSDYMEYYSTILTLLPQIKSEGSFEISVILIVLKKVNSRREVVTK